MAGFWKPGSSRPEIPASLDVDKDGDNGGTLFFSSKYSSLSMKDQRERLPIFKHKTALLYLVENHSTTIIVGQTGSGKTTQIPQYLEEAGWATEGRVIGCTQPRRVAVQTVSLRVAEEFGCSLGQEVGYTIRFENMSTPNVTRIKYLTDGILLREMMEDPLLSKYSVLMVDEAHERSTATDLLLGLLKKVQKRRPELRLVVASATMEAEAMADFFDSREKRAKASEEPGAPSKKPAIMSLEGRMHPVQLHYLQHPCTDYLRTAVDTALEIHAKEPPGDILVFLTGQEEVDHALRQIQEDSHAARRGLMALPLYSGLSRADQDLVFAPTPRRQRKVILATNIAETSITIQGIVYVVDSGFSKLNFFDPVSNTEALVVCPISRASALQRAGRAGRVRPGKCFRLYTEEYYVRDMSQSTPPEIQRSSLAPIVLQLKSLGVDNLMRFGWPSPPPPPAMVRALELLFALGALDQGARLTHPGGTHLAEVPLEPSLGAFLLASPDHNCSEEALTIAASLTVQSLWVTSVGHRQLDEAKSRFAAAEGDFVSYLNVFEGFLRSGRSGKWCHSNCVNYRAMLRVVDVRAQLRKLLGRLGRTLVSCEGEVEAVRRAATAGFFMNCAQHQPFGDGTTYKTLRGGLSVKIHPTSVLFRATPKWVVFQTCSKTESETYIKEICTIEPSWLTEIAPHFYKKEAFSHTQ